MPHTFADDGGGGSESLPAETVRLRAGGHKNKTSAQVIFEKGAEHADEQVKALTDTYNRLRNNHDQGSKYAGAIRSR